MVKLKVLFVCAIVLKVITAYVVNVQESYNEGASSLVEYDYLKLEETSTLNDIRRSLLDFSRQDTNIYKSFNSLLREIDDLVDASTEEYLSAVHRSRLKSDLALSLEYENNLGLSDRHNFLLCQQATLLQIASRLDTVMSKKESLIDRPYLVSLDVEEDSMEVAIAYGLSGPVNKMTLLNKGVEQPLDSLPIRIEEVEGQVKLCVVDPVSGNKVCYGKEFY